MRAIIHSIHSQVPRTIAKLNQSFDTIVSLDSHLDVSLGGDDLIYPEALRMIARRTGAHTAMSQMTGGRPSSRPGVVVAVPERMLARHAMDTESNLPRPLRVLDERESIASIVNFFRKERGIEIFQSPPENLLNLIPRTRRAKSWLLDIDVDYMQEMQNECYTRIINPSPGVLQSMARVVEFVLRSRPRIITLSEAKVSAIRDERSAFSKFVGKLRVMGYEIEEGDIAVSDAEVVRGINVCKSFYGAVSKTLMVNHMDEMMRGDLKGFLREEEAAARKFFAGKGYAY
jgi:hypothetical protein